MEFEHKINQVVYMIHDQAVQFKINYLDYGIRCIKSSVMAPNMNALAEPFVGSIRREALDNYLLISENQIMKILKEYFEYYNTKRPHQGLNQMIPMGYKPMVWGKVDKVPILGGLCYHYIRRAA